MGLRCRLPAGQPPPSLSCPHPLNSPQLYPASALSKTLTQSSFIPFHAKYCLAPPVRTLGLDSEKLSLNCLRPSSVFGLGSVAKLSRLLFLFYVWDFGSTPRCRPNPTLQSLSLTTALPGSAAAVRLQPKITSTTSLITGLLPASKGIQPRSSFRLYLSS